MEKNCHLASPVNLRVPYHASLQPRLLRKTVTLESKLVFVSAFMENHFACHFCLLTILAAYLRLVIAQRGCYKMMSTLHVVQRDKNTPPLTIS